MNRHGPIDEQLSQWFLDEATAEIPDRVLEATFARTRAARQDRALLPWRVREMLPRALAVAAIAAAIAIAAASMVGLGRPSASVGGPASPSASPRPSPDRSFDMEAWTLRYLRPSDDWHIEGGLSFNKDIHIVHDEGLVSVGRLMAVVDPNSIYVTQPDLDLTVDTSPDGFLAWLDRHPRVDTTDPVDVTIDGRPARQVDVTLKAGERFAQGETPSRLGLVYFGQDAAAIGPSDGETHRFIVFEVGGETAVVDVWSHDVEAFAPIAQVVLDALVFEE